MITFAVVGHNEAPTLPRALTDALAARRDGDEVVFVDSASTDDSAEVAEAHGVRVLSAPLGKGRAMQAALDACTTRLLCFVDGDIHGSSDNIPERLATCARTTEMTMVVGEFSERGRSILSNTVAIYGPLVAHLVPEAADRYGSRPLTGFRVIDATRDWGPLPPDFGVEAYLNVMAPQFGGAATCVCSIGLYEGRFLYKPTMGLEIAKPILDFAQRAGRIDAQQRAAWDAWVQVAVDHIATFRGEPERREAFRRRLLELAARPAPV